MTTGGGAIPRLQELSYLEVVALGVADGASFEELRRAMVNHMIAVGEASPGTGNIATFRNAISNPKRYVRNVTEALSEHMRLGLVEKATLPSSASSAHAYRSTTFALTVEGQVWVQQLRTDRRDAYDALCTGLLKHHPQFGGFLQAVGVLVPSANDALVIPLLRWGDTPKPRTRSGYIDHLAARVFEGVNAGKLGWTATETEVAEGVRAYTDAIVTRAVARERPDPFPRNRDFVNSCEEALVKLAFGRAGFPLDYISMAILRRWTRTLALVNFSYHAPGPNALRLWPTASITLREAEPAIQRRVGPAYRDQVLEALRDAYQLARRNDPTGSAWVPIYRVRAALCWSLRIPDSEFDVAILEFLRNERGQHLPYGVSLDQASYGSIPPSERPLVVTAPSGTRVFKSLSLVLRSDTVANDQRSLS